MDIVGVFSVPLPTWRRITSFGFSFDFKSPDNSRICVTVIFFRVGEGIKNHVHC